MTWDWPGGEPWKEEPKETMLPASLAMKIGSGNYKAGWRGGFATCLSLVLIIALFVAVGPPVIVTALDWWFK